jgi:hypothetical protein
MDNNFDPKEQTADVAEETATNEAATESAALDNATGATESAEEGGIEG